MGNDLTNAIWVDVCVKVSADWALGEACVLGLNCSSARFRGYGQSISSRGRSGRLPESMADWIVISRTVAHL